MIFSMSRRGMGGEAFFSTGQGGEGQGQKSMGRARAGKGPKSAGQGGAGAGNILCISADLIICYSKGNLNSPCNK